ncbi:low temperature requirement protein A [Companilactobacillus sp.]|jgi:low temperature requirement protein LtrA|uniref:low temperature requirement protein A n=1 Tax=Companilactobacillus sp. TaxID=2767905 RepID=UPI0025B86D96|nr:low temperature requirement protein A [Companilactobacillus sp.]MCH4009149.1 low temperature requirement protein A [Companilactobacillus sp.]MCH4050672.1 low temperature requirement protein A [Companilactobacillus sp.]MCH4077091.1 low temperature requirement protein A [Companilactobacillus sp.]MCH4125667.1 low temperature requirement protein A [Companilactobacillus sp.]MCI1311376.1 low temperature requirement protein A [Companilactobacillus sp.]
MDKSKHSWWGTPRKITNIIRDRKISWLELFSDLVFIIAIHYLISGFSENISLVNFFRFILVFLLVFDIWNTYTNYFDLHGNTSIRTTFFTMLMVLGVAVLSSTIVPFFDGHYQVFVVVYLLIQILTMYLWIRIVYYDPAHMLTTKSYLIESGVQIALLVVILLISNVVIQSAILTVIIISKSASLITERNNFNKEFKQRHIPFEISSAVQERYGTFTMIVLGEAIATIVEQLDGNYSFESISHFILLALNIIGIFWMYYALMDSVHVKGKSYLKLVLFRGFHIGFLLMLSLETFFMVNLAETKNIWIRLGFITSLILVIGLIFALKEFSKTTHRETTSFVVGTGIMLILYLTVLFPANIILLLSDIYLIVLVILHEHAQFIRGESAA